MNEMVKRKDNENEEQFIWRIGQLKDAGTIDMDWEEVADIINHEFRSNEDEYRVSSAYRKPYQEAKRFYEANVFKDLTSEVYAKIIREEQQNLKKEKQKLSDERVELQRLLREQARRESFIDTIKSAMAKEVERLDYVAPITVEESDNDMIVCLSDLHTGLEVNSAFNNFNTDILKVRLQEYLTEIKEIQETYKCKNCYLVLGGDLISGSIHIQIRLENNENVIEQVKVISILVGDFIRELQNIFEDIHIYSVSGNHSRLSPDKENQLKGEELDALVPFYLEIMFSNNKNIHFYKNMIDDTILAFRTRGGKLFYGVHGDRDSLSAVVKNLTLMTGTKPDGIILGHRHHNALETEHGVKVIQCGSVIGMDNYCIDHRISGRPEQCVVVTNQKSTVKAYFDIGLD